jgi:UDP-N-acetylmuramoylalanine-D-glutamate ligase
MKKMAPAAIERERHRIRERAEMMAAEFMVKEGLASIAEAARMVGISRQAMRGRLRSFDPAPKRAEVLKTIYERTSRTYYRHLMEPTDGGERLAS